MKKLLLGTFVLMSTIIGVGMFGIPYAGAQSGFLITGALLIVLTAIMIAIHLFYADIISVTKEKRRLPGYAEKYLGKNAKFVVGLFVIVGFYGSLLVYTIVGGNFLNTMLSGYINLPAIVFNLIFFIIGSVAVYFGLKLISGIDFLMGLFLVVIIAMFLIFGYNNINIDNLKTINLKNILIPYGAILYSLAGIAIIPELSGSFKKERKQYKKVIIWGTIIPGLMYLIFTGIVIGLTGSRTSEEAIGGLVGVLGKGVVFWGSVFGFFATITSFFALGLSLKQTYIFDFKIKKGSAWLLTCIVPFLLFIAGIHSFVTVITVLGATMGLIECSSIVLMHQRTSKNKNRFELLIIPIFIIGFIYTIAKIL
jgi:tyrosine-specific transport protein